MKMSEMSWKEYQEFQAERLGEINTLAKEVIITNLENQAKWYQQELNKLIAQIARIKETK